MSIDQSQSEIPLGSYVANPYKPSEASEISDEEIENHKKYSLLGSTFFEQLPPDLQDKFCRFEAFIFEELDLRAEEYNRYLIGLEEGVYREEVRGFGNNGGGVLLTFIVEIPTSERWKSGKSRYRSDLKIVDFIDRKTLLENAHSNFIEFRNKVRSNKGGGNKKRENTAESVSNRLKTLLLTVTGNLSQIENV